uniref:Late embryogenesis abundant protein LEA-2 subgroup domain-containing protein n=1 Tax=Oryza meridionalis TaxID=40149 RepID=A0A0E0DFZ4_9ORYZ
MGSRSPRDDGRREAARAAGVAAALIAASLFCLFIALVLQSTSTSTSGGGGGGGGVREERGGAVYSAAVTVLSGLHPSNDLLHIGTLFPVFNLTVHVEVLPGGKAGGGVCLGGHSVSAVVSYDGAFLGEGSVGRVCVEPQQQEGAVAATAWGRNVWMPWVLRRRLAEEMKRGEAELEVAVPMRGGHVLVCKAKIGGDLSPCTLEASN